MMLMDFGTTPQEWGEMTTAQRMFCERAWREYYERKEEARESS
jgi:hypothetical protein